jgi:hypothetical protein
VTKGKDEKRAFERFAIAEQAIVTDEKGATLGHVEKVGGGGMTLRAESAAVAQKLEPGHALRVTIVEPSNQVSNTLDVVIRYRSGSEVGVQFVSGSETGRFPALK